MVNLYDLKSKNVVIGTATANTTLGIGRVPDGKQRFVTFVKATNLETGAGGTNTLYLASHSASQLATLAAATAAKKMTIPFVIGAANQSEQVPGGQPDMLNPLLNIAASNFLSARTSRGNVDLFVQYYDE
ncbi:MAG: hypothetical protein KAJ19_03195 [Gammaproteobacteria bacterium]|nr:hypothetical protein [Gammaproteobacteria bacterium]